jgi:Putative bacterial sensory transduction regulator
MRWFRRDEPDDDAARAGDERPAEPGPPAIGPAVPASAMPPVPARPPLPPPPPLQGPARHRADDPYPPEVQPPVPAPTGEGATRPAVDRAPDPSTDPAALPVPEDDPHVVAPITPERLERALRRHGYRYATDPAGMLRGNWDGNGFTIDLVGSPATVLQVRGTWSRALDPDLAPGLAQVVNDWNRDRIWPKVYTRTVNGRIRVHSEVSVDLGPGASDAQIDECLACGLGTGVQLFTQLTGLIEPNAGPAPTNGTGPVDGSGPASGRRPD